MWSGDMRESDINSISVSPDNQLIAVGDNFGRPRVFCYPAYIPKQNSYSLNGGHVNHVVCV